MSCFFYHSTQSTGFSLEAEAAPRFHYLATGYQGTIWALMDREGTVTKEYDHDPCWTSAVKNLSLSAW